ncbi:hypothetical protein IWQ61_001183 [Dispira simplex]|nr:hypothetical protein IWQ61_001183 [Dispira simplex]
MKFGNNKSTTSVARLITAGALVLGTLATFTYNHHVTAAATEPSRRGVSDDQASARWLERRNHAFTQRNFRRGEEFSGDGTYYSPSVGTGSCGWLNSDDEYVAALNADQFGNPTNPNSSPFCGKKIKVDGPKGSVEATIVDKCPVCKHGDIDLSTGAFDQIADQAEGRVPITWSFMD